MRDLSSSSKRFLTSFAAVASLVVIVLIVAALACPEGPPGADISDNRSFNEKAKWLGHRLTGTSKIDVLVIGSSMALNNVNGPELRRRLDAPVVVNTGSWGLDIAATRQVMEGVLQRATPRLIVLPVYHGDFVTRQWMHIQWPAFSHLLSGHSLSAYFDNPDLGYYAQAIVSDWADHLGRHTTYYSLAFDDTGGVPLAHLTLERTTDRWEWYRQEQLHASDFADQSFASLAAIAAEAHRRGATLYVAAGPLRPVAERTFAPQLRAELWSKVQRILAANGAHFIPPPPAGAFDDTAFADYCHLNDTGSEAFTERLCRFIAPEKTH